MNEEVKLGDVVCSKNGRFKGEHFVILALDAEYAYISNGKSRKSDSPKKKKIKHLEAKSDCITGIRDKLMEEKKVFDSQIRSALDGLGYLEK